MPHTGAHNVVRRYVESAAAIMAGRRRRFTHNAIMRTCVRSSDLSLTALRSGFFMPVRAWKAA